MYHNRVKRAATESCWYLVTNRVVGGSFLLGQYEKEKLRALIVGGQERLGYKVWDFVILDNHYHCLLQICPADQMSRMDVLKRWQIARDSESDPGDAVLEGFRQKIHDVSFVVSNFQQRFTQWYNTRNDRWGRLFGGRFDSVILDKDGAVARVMAYITLNPVRAGICTDPAEYRWCGYAERMAKGRLQEDDRQLAAIMQRELGLPDQALKGTDKTVLDRLWSRFRQTLLGRSVRQRSVDAESVADVLNRANKPLDLTWPQRLMLKARFVTKGIALGSREFVEQIGTDFRSELGENKKHHATDARAWDETYSLRKHKKWIG